MRNLHSGMLVVWVVGLLAGGARAAVDVDLVAWFPDLKGQARESANLADTIDVGTDLGVRNENFPELRYNWQLGRKTAIRGFYTFWRYSGNNVLNRNFTFENSNYVIGDQVLSSVDLNVFRIGVHWQPLQWRTLQLGVSLNVTPMWGDATLTVPARGINERISGIVPLPTPGVSVHYTPTRVWDIYCDAAGITAGDYGYLYEIEAGVKLRPDQYLHVLAGWRTFNLKAKDNNDFVRLQLQGPVFGAGWEF